MPLSRPDTYPAVLNLIWEANPKSILDVGCGWGAMGVLFRSICDIRWGRMTLWNTVIHGIEANAGYQNSLWTMIYNHVYIGDAVEKIAQTDPNYDIVYMGDVVEHLPEEKAKKLIELAIAKANRFVIITTPASFADNKEEAKRFANKMEEHQVLVDASYYPADAVVEQYANQKVIIIKK